jgi:hypothetical protein
MARFTGYSCPIRLQTIPKPFKVASSFSDFCALEIERMRLSVCNGYAQIIRHDISKRLVRLPAMRTFSQMVAQTLLFHRA